LDETPASHEQQREHRTAIRPARQVLVELKATAGSSLYVFQVRAPVVETYG
jgi:hypothetical protein